MEGQSQRRGAPRGLGAAAAGTDAKGMDVAEALEVSAESAAGADLRPRPAGWETWTRNQRRSWLAAQRKKQRK